MDRSSSLPIVLVALGVVLVGVLAWVFWPSTPLAPAEQRAPGLADSASVTWVSQNVTSAEMRSEEDLEWTLGYVHGLRRTWSLLLWRQTATGHLSSWFGTGVAPLDRHVHQLGIPFQSKRAYAALPDSIRRRVRAYTRGVNAALSTPSAQEHDELLALEHTPEPWMPWHTLAVEHLFSWLSTPQPVAHENARDAQDPSSERVAFAQTDALLRSFLHVRGLDRSVAWSHLPSSAPDQPESSGAQLTSRLVTGSTAMPILHEVSFTITGGASERVVSGGTLPGSLVWLSGSHSRKPSAAGASSTAWAVLPGHAPSLRRLPADSLTVHRRYVRLTPRDADEQSVEIRRVDLPGAEPSALRAEPMRGIPLSLPSLNPSPGAPPPVDSLVVDSIRTGAAVLDAAGDTAVSDTASVQAPDPAAQDSIPVDSIWVMSWNGLRGRSDAGSWTALSRGEMQPEADAMEQATPFSLHDGTGLLLNDPQRANEDATVRLLGKSPYVIRANGRTVVGRSAWTGPVAQSLVRHTGPGAPPRAGVEVRSDTSQWAAMMLQDVLPNLESLASSGGRVQEALTYLRNWDATFERSSIGASVFEIWLDEYASGTDTPHRRAQRMRLRLSPPSRAASDSLRPDTTYFAAHRQRRAFRRAVHRLTEEHGPDLRQWRWERVAPNRRFFPVWSADSLIARDVSELATTRYAPIDVPGRGHPSTPSGGPSLLSGVGDPYAAVWTSWIEPGQQALVVRRSVFDVSGFLARPFLRRDETADVSLSPDSLIAPTGGDPSQVPVRTRLVPAER